MHAASYVLIILPNMLAFCQKNSSPHQKTNKAITFSVLVVPAGGSKPTLLELSRAASSSKKVTQTVAIAHDQSFFLGKPQRFLLLNLSCIIIGGKSVYQLIKQRTRFRCLKLCCPKLFTVGGSSHSRNNLDKKHLEENKHPKTQKGLGRFSLKNFVFVY